MTAFALVRQIDEILEELLPAQLELGRCVIDAVAQQLGFEPLA